MRKEILPINIWERKSNSKYEERKWPVKIWEKKSEVWLKMPDHDSGKKKTMCVANVLCNYETIDLVKNTLFFVCHSKIRTECGIWYCSL